MTFYSRKIFESGNSGLKKPELDNKPVCLPCLRNPTKHGIPTALVFSLGIAGAAFLIISYFALRRFASQRRSSLPPPTYSNREEFADGLQWPEIDHPVWHIRTNGLPQSVIESIQQFSYKKGDGFIGTSDCSVCLSEFEDGESLRLLPKCSHAFHGACIDTWLGSHTNCPLCRGPILGGGGGQLGTVESRSILVSSGREGNGGIESQEEGSGEIGNGGGNSNRAMIGEEMEGVRRSVSLDFSSAVDVNVEAKKAFWTKRSISISGPLILV